MMKQIPLQEGRYTPGSLVEGLQCHQQGGLGTRERVQSSQRWVEGPAALVEELAAQMDCTGGKLSETFLCRRR